jgi:5-methylcytosine-specific restriction endonuclease McrBC regulatory subunit McrC
VKPLRLRERRPRLCRLAPDEVRHLLGHHRAHLDLTPTADRHVWRVRPAGVAGVILTPRRRIVIEAKVPTANLLFPFDADSCAVRPGDDPLDALAGQLALRMAERAAAGLHRGYRERAHQGPFLVGRLDLPAQLREPPGRKEQIHSRLDDFTADLPCNQVPKALAARLAASAFLGDPARARLRQAAAAFGPVGDIDLSADALARLARAPAPPGYRPLVDLCLILTSALGADVAGPAALLVSLERWFERFVTRAIEAAFGDGAHAQRVYHVGDPGVTVRPDVAVERGRQVRLVVDAKWKRLGTAGPDSDDLYQVLAYAGLLGAADAALAYPGRGRAVTLTFDRLPTRVHLCRVSVSGPPDRFARQLRTLGLTP